MPLLRRVKITESQLSFLLYFSMKKTQLSLKMLQRLSGLQKSPKETEFYPYKQDKIKIFSCKSYNVKQNVGRGVFHYFSLFVVPFLHLCATSRHFFKFSRQGAIAH